MKRFALILMVVAGLALCTGCGNRGGKKADNKDEKVDIEKVADKMLEDPEVQKQVEKALKDASK